MQKELSMRFFLLLLSIVIFNCGLLTGQSAKALDPNIFQGLKLRNLTPAKTGGRIVDIAIDPNQQNIWYAAAASGNVWKTTNAGTSWKAIFEKYGSYSIGTIEIDPNDSQTIWLGTGENNSQRSVSKGDGIYKSVDGGGSWSNMGLKSSEHIGKIMIDPRNSDVVYVAAQGGLWAPGGERGLYKTMDGGKNWKRILHISENTGISDIIYDPRNPDILLVSSYQRRRHVGVLVAGGPDGGIWKSTDAGENWNRLSTGLPFGDLGRIGLAISPQRPDVVYALIAGTEATKGFYRSENGGDTWVKRSDYMVIDAQYYMELFPDPHQFDRVYSVNVLIGVTEDGGKTFQRVNNQQMHVDHHDITFDPKDPNHMLIGNDGGIYETRDRGQSWRFFDNLPLTQYYRVGIDNATPFYNVYGGTQDNATLGGPSRTIKADGISNSDWFVTVGGDGFQTRVDPDNPDIIYSQSQYGRLIRYDKQSGERIDIQPQAGPSEPPLNWYWDSPLLISPHNKKRLYFAAQKVFRSDDRGNSWTAISDDLSLGRDRNKLPVMDRVWGVDAIFKNVWTSPLGTVVALDESPLREGLIYAGTDEGVIHYTENSGASWQKIEGFPGVPEYAFVADIHASKTNPDKLYVIFNNHKFGDYKAYIFKSEDRGASWTSIGNNFPTGEHLWSIVQDHENEHLLFLGSEYGLYFSLDDGQNWTKFKAGIPTIAIRDLEIQQRENDLVAASFGRGFYILDDYSPLRHLNAEALAKGALLFPVKDAWQYVQKNGGGRSLGHGYYTSPNPSYGAVFTYYLKESAKSLAQQRKQQEQNQVKDNQPVFYPSWEDYVAEKHENAAMVIISIKNERGDLVRRITGPASKGIHRVNWDLRHVGANTSSGVLVAPGKYTAHLTKIVNNSWKDLGLEVSFQVKPLANRTLPADNALASESFGLKVTKLRKEVMAFDKLCRRQIEDLERISKIALSQPSARVEDHTQAHQLISDLKNLLLQLNGNHWIVDKMELIPPSINNRVNRIYYSLRGSTASPTKTQLNSYQIALKAFQELEKILDKMEKERIIPLQKLYE